MRILVLINPISGRRRGPGVVEQRVAMASALARAHRVEADVVVTQRQGHARDVAQRALDEGVGLCIAWGGDGTINEIGSALAHREASLAIIPSGSGNGLARELRIPFDPTRAFEVALNGADRAIDCGELGGQLFFNLAGMGLDARVAHEFAAKGLVRRGFRRYLEITLRELFRSAPDEHTIVAGDVTLRTRAMLIAFANGRQYGNGAIIAPRARLDDGVLDLVVVEDRAPWKALLAMPLVFAGQAHRVPGVTIVKAPRFDVTSARPMLFHVDGEPRVGGAHLVARVHEGALRVRVPGGPSRAVS